MHLIHAYAMLVSMVETVKHGIVMVQLSILRQYVTRMVHALHQMYATVTLISTGNGVRIGTVLVLSNPHQTHALEMDHV